MDPNKALAAARSLGGAPTSPVRTSAQSMQQSVSPLRGGGEWSQEVLSTSATARVISPLPGAIPGKKLVSSRVRGPSRSSSPPMSSSRPGQGGTSTSAAFVHEAAIAGARSPWYETEAAVHSSTGSRSASTPFLRAPYEGARAVSDAGRSASELTDAAASTAASELLKAAAGRLRAIPAMDVGAAASLPASGRPGGGLAPATRGGGHATSRRATSKRGSRLRAIRPVTRGSDDSEVALDESTHAPSISMLDEAVDMHTSRLTAGERTAHRARLDAIIAEAVAAELGPEVTPIGTTTAGADVLQGVKDGALQARTLPLRRGGVEPLIRDEDTVAVRVGGALASALATARAAVSVVPDLPAPSSTVLPAEHRGGHANTRSGAASKSTGLAGMHSISLVDLRGFATAREVMGLATPPASSVLALSHSISTPAAPPEGGPRAAQHMALSSPLLPLASTAVRYTLPPAFSSPESKAASNTPAMSAEDIRLQRKPVGGTIAAPVIHLVPQSQTVQALRHGDPAAKQSMLHEWLESYEHDVDMSTAGALAHSTAMAVAQKGAASLRRSSAFVSDILEAQVRLTRARIFCEPLGRPSDLVTASAFDLMDSVLGSMLQSGPAVAHFAGILREVQAVLAQSIYSQLGIPSTAADGQPMHRYLESAGAARGPASSGAATLTAVEEVGVAGLQLGSPASTPQHKAGVATLGQHAANVVKYYTLTTYYTLVTALAAERDTLMTALKELTATLESWEKGRLADARSSEMRHKVARRWQVAAFRELRNRKVGEMQDLVEQQRKRIDELEAQTHPTVEAMVAIFGKLTSDTDRANALIQMLTSSPASWAPVLRHLLTQIPLSLVMRLTAETLSERTDVNFDDIASFSSQLLKLQRVRASTFAVSLADGSLDEHGATGRGTSRGGALADRRGAASSSRGARDRRGADSDDAGAPPVTEIAGQLQLIISMMDAVKDVAGAVPSMLKLLSEHEACALMRFLVGIDKWILPARDLRKHLTGDMGGVGHGLSLALTGTSALAMSVPGVKTVAPGVFRSLMEGLTMKEKRGLLSDLLLTLGGSALPVVADALLLSGGGLNEEAQHADDHLKRQMIELFMTGLPQEVICSMLTCPFHNHAFAEMVASGGLGSTAAAGLAAEALGGTAGRRASMGAQPGGLAAGGVAGGPATAAQGGMLPAGGPAGPSNISSTGDGAESGPQRRIASRSAVASRYLFSRVGKTIKQRPKMNLQNTLSMVYDAYARKIMEDETDAKHAYERASLADFMKFFMLQKFGLQTMADSYMVSLIESTQRLARRSVRLRMFGQMIGILDVDSYSPRMSAVFLHLLKMVYPNFNAAVLRLRREGKAFIPVDKALAAATYVFVDHNLGLARDKIMLTSGRKQQLLTAIQNAAEPYEKAFTRAAAAEAAAAAEKAAAAASGTPSFAQPLNRSARDGRRIASGAADDDDDDSGAIAASSVTSFLDESKMTTEQKIETGKEYLPHVMVVDFDVWMHLCLNTWQKQVDADGAGIRKLYVAYDEDGNGVLSFEEFCNLVRSCAPSMKEYLTDLKLSQMFEEAHELESTAATPLAGGAVDAEDALSPDAFALLCDRYGIVPYRKPSSARAGAPSAGSAPGATGAPGSDPASVDASTSDAASSGAAAAAGAANLASGLAATGLSDAAMTGVEDDDFAPIRRLVLRKKFQRAVSMAASMVGKAAEDVAGGMPVAAGAH